MRESRYLLFTGDCPVQQEDMPKMKGKEPESQDIVLKAGADFGPAVVIAAASTASRQSLARPCKPTC